MSAVRRPAWYLAARRWWRLNRDAAADAVACVVVIAGTAGCCFLILALGA